MTCEALLDTRRTDRRAVRQGAVPVGPVGHPGGMRFIHKDLGQRKKGDVVEVTLSSGANVRLLDSHNLSAYRNGSPA